MTVSHMQTVEVEEATAAIEAASVVERKISDPENGDVSFVELDPADALAAATVATARQWVKVARNRFYLRMEVADEVFALTSVTPIDD